MSAIFVAKFFVNIHVGQQSVARVIKRAYSLQAIGASLQKIWKSHSVPISTKIRRMKTLVWPVAMYGRESKILRKNEETRLDAFENE